MTSETTPAPRVIRRYSNRKLYDPTARRYVTLEAVAGLIAGGQEVEIVEQGSGEDITNLVLAQVLLEGLRQRTARVPRQVLARLIRLAAGPASDWGHWPEPREAAGRAGDEAEKIAGRFLSRGRPSLEDAVALREEIGQLVHRLVTEAQSGLEARFRGLLQMGEGAAGRSLGALRLGLNVFEGRSKEPATRSRHPRSKRRTRSRSIKR
ncbi:MAG: polyhydroxyalkanoate synthesis regulator DNA-binding domain-containing protein [Acidobacteriota bacterium]